MIIRLIIRWRILFSEYSSSADSSFLFFDADILCLSVLSPPSSVLSLNFQPGNRQQQSKMRVPCILVSFLLSTLPACLGASDSKIPAKPCTIHSPSTGSFFDLRPLQLTVGGTKFQDASNESYHAKGYDYPANFTLNFCGPVVERIENVEGLAKQRWANVSAFYKDHFGDIYSIGQRNDQPIFRGKKLVMNYTLGSPCPELDEDGIPIDASSLQRRRWYSGEEGEENRLTGRARKEPARRKSTLLSFICDTSPLLSTRPAISFLGSPDHCTYVFEVRSRYACAGATPSGEKGTLGPGGVFGVILGIALLVYLIGGIVYQRNVMHQRGWRQLPNYVVWASVISFISVSAFLSRFLCRFLHVPTVQSAYKKLAGRRRGPQISIDILIDGFIPRADSFACAGYVCHSLLFMQAAYALNATALRRSEGLPSSGL